MLIKQGPGKIDWCDVTWNPTSGCTHNCSYCYMQRLVKRFDFDMTPKFYPNRLKDLEKLKKPSKIFVCSSGDIFSPGIKDEWIQQVIDTVKKYPQHTFQFLSKNPKRYRDFEFPKNCWLGGCVDGLERTIHHMRIMASLTAPIKFVSFEPLIKFPYDLSKIDCMDWIIIGADSNLGAEQPPDKWADNILILANRYKIPVFIKDNYHYKTKVKEFPK